jgi:hypothetical protein
LAAEPAHGPAQEGRRRLGALVAKRLDVGEAAVVVDADVEEVPALG